MIRRMVLIAAFASLLPCLAMAGSVTFMTTGVFGSSGTNASSQFPTLTFAGVGTTVNAPPLGINTIFGTFSFRGCNKCTGSDPFTLHIDQSVPSSGSGDIDVTLVGLFTPKQKSLDLVFATAVVTVGTVTYQIPFHESINIGSKKSPAQTSLNGIVRNIAVPEPDARLLLGLGTLGLMGLTLVSRKMINF